MARDTAQAAVALGGGHGLAATLSALRRLKDDLTIDEWAPEFTLICLAHGDDCDSQGGDHNYTRRRTLTRYPAGTYRPCGSGAGHDGIYRYRFQVDGRWRGRFGCRSHHHNLLDQHLAEADGTVSVAHMNDHLHP